MREEENRVTIRPSYLVLRVDCHGADKRCRVAVDPVLVSDIMAVSTWGGVIY